MSNPPINPSLAKGILGVGFSLLLGFSASADQLDDRASNLLPWVAQQTGYSMQNVKATVIIVEPRTINLIAYRVNAADNPQPEAITAGATIFLPTWFKLGENDDILVHELTHVLQYANAAKFRCLADRERQAYETQAAFAAQTGIGEKPDAFFLFLLRCTAYPVQRQAEK